MNQLVPVEAQTTGEIATSAVTAQAMAAVQARYLLALRRPRNIEQVRQDLLKECRRTTFAEKARYAKPVGSGTVQGPSIRFIEAALRAFGNVDQDVSVLWDGPESRTVRVTVTDLETNLTYRRDIVINKTVERKAPRPGQNVISQRTNTTGKVVYLVEASEEELANKEAALVSKAIRQLGQRLLPGDLVEEAQDVCVATKAAKTKEDPDAARKRIADAFVAVGVQPADIAEYLGHAIGKSTPKEVDSLREIYESITAGETTWAEVMDSRKAPDDDAASTAKAKTADITARLRSSHPSEASPP